MPAALHGESTRIGRWLRALASRVDGHFIDESVIGQGVDVLGCARMGVVSSFLVGISIVMGIAFHTREGWTPGTTLVLTSIGAALIGLPFLLRRRSAIVYIGHGVCGGMVLYSVAAPLLTGAPDGSVLVISPAVPAIAAVACRGRSCAAWGTATLIALGIVYLGLSPEAPALPFDDESRRTNRLFSTAFATLLLTGIGSISRAVSDRSIEDVADFALTSVHARDARYRALLEHASEGVCVFDAKARVTYSSPAVRRLFDLGDESPVGRTMASFTHPDDLAERLPAWRWVRSEPNGVVRVQIRARAREDRDWKHFDTILSNNLDTPGVHGIVVHLRDATELRQSDEKYRLLVDNSPNGVAVVVGSTIVYSNDALAEIIGVDPEKVGTTAFQDLLDFDHDGDRKRILADWESLAERLVDDETIAIRTVHDVPRFVQIRWMEITWEGRRARQVIIQDVTAKYRLEESRVQQQKELELRIQERTRELEVSQQRLRDAERLASLGTLAAGVAHQINNPVGSILACAELGLIEAGADADPDQIRLLEDIRLQAIRCGRIANGLLHFARKQSGTRTLGRVASAVRSATAICEAEARANGAEITLDFESEYERSWSMIDSIQIEQVFVNLLRNAFESRDGGVRIEIHGRVDAGESQTLVRDDGPGVSPADRPHIFEPFFTTRLHQGGTGLGLSVAHGIVAAHDGTLRLDPDAASGAVFVVRIPTVLDRPTPN